MHRVTQQNALRSTRAKLPRELVKRYVRKHKRAHAAAAQKEVLMSRTEGKKLTAAEAEAGAARLRSIRAKRRREKAWKKGRPKRTARKTGVEHPLE